MNRIIIIGNGFDLAHGLKTSYKDFIDWYWSKWMNKLAGSINYKEEDKLCRFETRNIGWRWSDVVIATIPQFATMPPAEAMKKIFENTQGGSVVFKSDFFAKICWKVENKNWVDIEDEYFQALKESSETNVTKLNEDFAIIKDLLVDYLLELQNSHTFDSFEIPHLQNKMFAPFKTNEISLERQNEWNTFINSRLEYNQHQLHELLASYDKVILNEDEVITVAKKHQHTNINPLSPTFLKDEKTLESLLYPEQVLILNFNYTLFANNYLPKITTAQKRVTINHIHGMIINKDSIIFGYGNNKDSSHIELLSRNNDEYLINIKDTNYPKATNLRELKRFAISAPYQLYIMGHSCGYSDKSLLQFLFENRNCVSIKPFYYTKSDGTTNYTEIRNNIRRILLNEDLVSDLVVIQNECESF